jgi:hypothetical protein
MLEQINCPRRFLSTCHESVGFVDTSSEVRRPFGEALGMLAQHKTV